MPYVKRDPEGRIVALYREPAAPNLEPISRGDAEVSAFLRDVDGDAEPAWAASDLAMARVVEDLIETLIDRNVIAFDDLPEAARSKIIARRALRLDLDDGDLFADTAAPAPWE